MIAKRVALLFFIGLILSTIVSGSVWYHAQLHGIVKAIADALHSIVGIALVYIIIPSVIALSILSKDNYFKLSSNCALRRFWTAIQTS